VKIEKEEKKLYLIIPYNYLIKIVRNAFGAKKYGRGEEMVEYGSSF